MRIAVVGCGLIGAAAARHLAMAGHEVVAIGPGEPGNKASHAGIFASHYDEGRIADRLDTEVFWTRTCGATIDRLAEIEAQSGISVFTPTGSIFAGHRDGIMRQVIAVAGDQGVAAEILDSKGMADRFPFFKFADSDVGLYEAANAGHLNPRALVRAQMALAVAAGAEHRVDVVERIEETGAAVVLHCSRGSVKADSVLVAAGCFTNALLREPLPILPYARTVSFFQVGADEVRRLAGMPTLVYELPTGREPYLLPPILYPDGRWYLKLGGDPVDIHLSDMAALKAWFRSDGSAEVAAGFGRHIRERMPGVKILSEHRQACVVTFTRSDRPLVDRLSDRIAVATAGCARGAMTSDELGRLGAEVVTGGPVVAELSLAYHKSA